MLVSGLKITKIIYHEEYLTNNYIDMSSKRHKILDKMVQPGQGLCVESCLYPQFYCISPGVIDSQPLRGYEI